MIIIKYETWDMWDSFKNHTIELKSMDDAVIKLANLVKTKIKILSVEYNQEFKPVATDKCLACVYPSGWLRNRNQAKINNAA